MSGVVFDPTADFVSRLPSASYLKGTILDPGLAVEEIGVAGIELRKFLAKRATLDDIRIQQLQFFDQATTQIGILSNYAVEVANLLQPAILLAQSLDPTALAEEIGKTAAGVVGQALSSSGNIYAQIAGAVIGFCLMLADFIEGTGEKLPQVALPTQEYDKDTDTDQFNLRIRERVQSTDWTPLFLPRTEGKFTVQQRKDAGGRNGFAIALGNGRIDQGDYTGADFGGGSNIGFLPGGARIQSVVQCTMMESPHKKSPFYETRCGSCRYSKGMKVRVQNVGDFYPACNRGLTMLWNTLQQPGPSMYAVDAGRLISAWEAYYGEIWSGIDWMWTYKAAQNYWGLGALRCALSGFLGQLTVGISDRIGNVGAYYPNTCDKKLDPRVWSKRGIFARIVQPAAMTLFSRQSWFLKQSTVSAYLTGQESGLGQFRTTFVDARRRILAGPERFTVLTRDVVDPEFRQALLAAGGGTDAGDGGLKPKGTVQVNRLVKSGVTVTQANVQAKRLGDSRFKATQDLAKPIGSKGGSGFETYLGSPAAPAVAASLGLGALFWLLR